MSQRTVLQLNPLNRAFHTHSHVSTLDFNAKFMRWAITWMMACLCAFSGSVSMAEEVQRGPDVVIIAGKDRVVYEFRQNGELRMVRVVPKWGKPYYLVPRDGTKGFGNLERADMLLPQWVIAEF